VDSTASWNLVGNMQNEDSSKEYHRLPCWEYQPSSLWRNDPEFHRSRRAGSPGRDRCFCGHLSG